MIIEVKDLIRNYNEDSIKILKNINFSAGENEFIAIMGKSGCGKTTFLKVLGLIDRPTHGEVYFKGRKTTELWKDELADIRRKQIGFIFQDFYLMDSLTVEENISLPMILDKQEETEMERVTAQYAEHFGIAHLMEKHPYELSGGEKQRVAFCRALVNNPDLILADEPTGNLDSKAGKIVIDALEGIYQEMKKTIILVTHDIQIASHCRKVVLLKDGEILDIMVRENGTGEKMQGQFYEEILRRITEL